MPSKSYASIPESPDKLLNEIIGLSKAIVERPCCCNLCGPRIRMLKELGGRIRERYSFLEATWRDVGEHVVIVPDDPGCFITRVINGFGTFLSCIGIGDKSFTAIIYDEKYDIVGRVTVEYRRKSNISYYYTRRILEEHKYILIPSNMLPRIERHRIVGDTGFNDIIAQAIGLYIALNYNYKLLIIHRSIITLGNELREAVTGTSSILIGSNRFYDKIKELLEAEITHIRVEEDGVSIGELEKIIGYLEKETSLKNREKPRNLPWTGS